MEKKMKPGAGDPPSPDRRILFGKHPVWEAVEHDRPLDRVYIQRGLDRTEYGMRLSRRLAKGGVPHTVVDKEALERLAPGANHQGVVALVALKEYLELDELLDKVKNEPHPFLLVLNKIQDPHNLGSLLRSADGAGVHGVIIPRHHACGLTPAAVKVASGAAEHIPVARVTNIGNALEKLGEEGYFLVGADAGAELSYNEIEYRFPAALVMGGEDKGLSPHITGKLHRVVKIPMSGAITSLNAGVAGAVMMFEIRKSLTSGKNRELKN
ncbi:MAG: 23S rRNA (guanosine(2251)-2'-O)-methyltransferase RlmB [Chloroflexi bacterium]|nr:23S rRNA (guanosine(2251)-2'-O)-methyltransferase RlmB [Chloroflexota bacterium]